jgi:hypothetical protein
MIRQRVKRKIAELERWEVQQEKIRHYLGNENASATEIVMNSIHETQRQIQLLKSLL